MKFEQFKTQGQFSNNQLLMNAMALNTVLIEALSKTMEVNNLILEKETTPETLFTLGNTICEILEESKNDEDDLIAQTCCRLLDMLSDDILQTAIVGITQE